MKYIISIIFLLICYSAFSQVYQEMPQYGYRANRFAFDSTLQIPTTCGVPTIKSVVSTNKKSAIAFDSCNNRFYYYNPVSATWILLTGGGQTIISDTAKVVIAQVRNAESTTLNVGEVVYLKGSTGNVASVKRASNRDDTTSSRTLGVVRESISANGLGYVVTQGQCEKMNLGGYAEGDVIWLDSIAGGITKNKPIAPFHGVFIGIVERGNQGNGIAYIKPANGFELSEIHDVQIINPLNNQILVYSDTQKIWKNRNQLDTTSLSNRINTKLAIVDTSNKWVNSVTKVNDTTIRVIKNTTTTDFIITGRVIDTTSLSNRINAKLAITDTSNKWVNSVTKLNDSTIRVIKNTTTSDLLIRGNPQQATGSNGLSGTSIIKLGGNLDDGTTAIESTTNGLSSISFGSTRKLDAFIIKNNQTTINSNNDIFLIQPTSGTDTTTYKPLGIASNGKISKINNWLGGTTSGGSVISVATGYGLSGGTITTTGTIIVDSSTLSNKYLRRNDTSNLVATKSNVAVKLNIVDTTNKWVSAVESVDDSTIRIYKGDAITDISIKGNKIYGTTNYLTKFVNDSTIGISQIYDNDTLVKIGAGGGTMAFPYELLVVEKPLDTKFGVYTSAESQYDGGASYVLGYTNFKTTESQLHPNFEYQMVGDADDSSNYVRYNYIARNDGGYVASSNINLLRLYSNKRVAFAKLEGDGNRVVETDGNGFISATKKTFKELVLSVNFNSGFNPTINAVVKNDCDGYTPTIVYSSTGQYIFHLQNVDGDEYPYTIDNTSFNISNYYYGGDYYTGVYRNDLFSTSNLTFDTIKYGTGLSDSYGKTIITIRFY